VLTDLRNIDANGCCLILFAVLNQDSALDRNGTRYGFGRVLEQGEKRTRLAIQT